MSKYNKSLYDDNYKNSDGENLRGSTKPINQNKMNGGEGLRIIRSKVSEIIRSLSQNDMQTAKKKALRLYQLVDYMQNQGFGIDASNIEEERLKSEEDKMIQKITENIKKELLKRVK